MQAFGKPALAPAAGGWVARPARSLARERSRDRSQASWEVGGNGSREDRAAQEQAHRMLRHRLGARDIWRSADQLVAVLQCAEPERAAVVTFAATPANFEDPVLPTGIGDEETVGALIGGPDLAAIDEPGRVDDDWPFLRRPGGRTRVRTSASGRCAGRISDARGNTFRHDWLRRGSRCQRRWWRCLCCLGGAIVVDWRVLCVESRQNHDKQCQNCEADRQHRQGRPARSSHSLRLDLIVAVLAQSVESVNRIDARGSHRGRSVGVMGSMPITTTKVGKVRTPQR
jgi:hypothetical protein